MQIYSIHQLEKLQKKYQMSGRRHSMWIISISQNYEVNEIISIKSFDCPNFLFNMTFISWLRNTEVMERITVMTIMREMIIVFVCLQISLISKRYSRRLSRKQISESYIWKVEFPLRRSQIYYQPESKVRNQNLSKTIDDVFFKKWIHSFLGTDHI